MKKDWSQYTRQIMLSESKNLGVNFYERFKP